MSSRRVCESSAMLLPEVGVLVGAVTRLEPLQEAHVASLVQAANENRSTYGFTTVPESAEDMASFVERLISKRSAGDEIPFVQVRRRDNLVVGMTRFLSVRQRPGATVPFAVEIGGTWLSHGAQHTGINRDAKLLLLRLAFETWEVARVDLKTDSRNERSRRAIVRLGARFEGVLRSWQPSQVADEQGQLRDTAIYSILHTEWPLVRDGLIRRIRQE